MRFSERSNLVLLGCLAAAMCLFGCWSGSPQLPQVPPYEIVEVVPGVWAAIANIGGSAVGNAGIIDMGDQTIVYDTGLTPEAGRQLRKAAEKLTGHEVTIVINSHFHDDHIGGNQSFDEPSYLSTTSTQRAVEAAGEKRSPESVEQARDSLQKITERLASEKDETVRRALTLLAGEFNGIVSSSHEFRRVVPTLVYDRYLNFTGETRRIKFMPTVISHTAGDALLWLEADSVLFASDLVSTDRHPFMRDGDPDGWMGVLDSMLTLNFKVLVPGHGPLGDHESVVRMREYLQSVDRAAEKALNGTPVESIPVDSAFADWMLDEQFGDNVRFVMDFRKK
ncbi:MAG: MBL fold metallo-hydrolase [Rhodothermales bacterium]